MYSAGSRRKKHTQKKTPVVVDLLVLLCGRVGVDLAWFAAGHDIIAFDLGSDLMASGSAAGPAKVAAMVVEGVLRAVVGGVQSVVQRSENVEVQDASATYNGSVGNSAVGVVVVAIFMVAIVVVLILGRSCREDDAFALLRQRPKSDECELLINAVIVVAGVDQETCPL